MQPTTNHPAPLDLDAARMRSDRTIVASALGFAAAMQIIYMLHPDTMLTTVSGMGLGLAISRAALTSEHMPRRERVTALALALVLLCTAIVLIWR